MEVAGVVFRQTPCFSNAGHSISFPIVKKPGSFRPKQQPNWKSVCALVGCDKFSDESHLQYYSGPIMEVKEKEEIVLKKKKEMKKKMKLLKGLSKNLSTFSDMGFGLDPDNYGLDHQVKGQMISEATDLLIGQLQKLKAEKMEYKKMKKEEKAKKKAARMMTECNDSSSSSSSSSESDCDNVVNMKQLKTVAASNTHQETTSLPFALPAVTPVQGLEKVENRGTDESCKKKIEVCMGGKCKKSGAEMLLENFKAAVRGEAEVVGCKCMGKCKDGPNVRVSSDGDEVANPLCIGVGLEDVDSIVTNSIGGSKSSCSDMIILTALLHPHL